MDFSKQFNQIKNSVVQILNFDDSGSITSTGSGVLIGDGSKVLTCSHCVSSNIEVAVRFDGQSSGPFGKVIFNDTVKDVAILDLEQSIGSGVEVNKNPLVKIGQEAFIVGFPAGIMQITALSANIAGFEPSNNFELIRLDSSVNHGNSGGPLFNSAGELIGIVNAKHGYLSEFLDEIQKVSPGVMMIRTSENLADPIKTLQTLVKEMKRNLNLGIGYAIPVGIIGSDNENFKKIINKSV